MLLVEVASDGVVEQSLDSGCWSAPRRFDFAKGLSFRFTEHTIGRNAAKYTAEELLGASRQRISSICVFGSSRPHSPERPVVASSLSLLRLTREQQKDGAPSAPHAVQAADEEDDEKEESSFSTRRKHRNQRQVFSLSSRARFYSAPAQFHAAGFDETSAKQNDSTASTSDPMWDELGTGLASNKSESWLSRCRTGRRRNGTSASVYYTDHRRRYFSSPVAAQSHIDVSTSDRRSACNHAIMQTNKAGEEANANGQEEQLTNKAGEEVNANGQEGQLQLPIANRFRQRTLSNISSLHSAAQSRSSTKCSCSKLPPRLIVPAQPSLDVDVMVRHSGDHGSDIDTTTVNWDLKFREKSPLGSPKISDYKAAFRSGSPRNDIGMSPDYDLLSTELDELEMLPALAKHARDDFSPRALSLTNERCTSSPSAEMGHMVSPIAMPANALTSQHLATMPQSDTQPASPCSPGSRKSSIGYPTVTEEKINMSTFACRERSPSPNPFASKESEALTTDFPRNEIVRSPDYELLSSEFEFSEAEQLEARCSREFSQRSLSRALSPEQSSSLRRAFSPLPMTSDAFSCVITKPDAPQRQLSGEDGQRSRPSLAAMAKALASRRVQATEQGIDLNTCFARSSTH